MFFYFVEKMVKHIIRVIIKNHIKKGRSNMVKGIKVTKKQQRFAQLIVQGKSQADAYEIAYNPNNKQRAVMRTNGCNLCRNPRVKMKIEEIRNEILQKGVATIEKIEKELAHIAFDDIKNYLSFRTEKQVVAWDEENNPVFEYRHIIELKNSEHIDTRAVAEVSLSNQGGFKFRLSSKDAALDKLAKIKGMYIERTENYNHNENFNINHKLEYNDDSIEKAYDVLYNKKQKQRMTRT